MNTGKKICWLCLIAFCGLTGCAAIGPPLPTVDWNTTEDARTILTERQNAIESVQTQVKIRYTSPPPESETNTFDGALVIATNDRFRLRTWKINQTIFDLTVTPEGTFIAAIDEMKERAPDSEADLAALANNLGAMLRGPDYAEARIETRGDTVRLFWGPNARPELAAEFDRWTLGLRAMRTRTANGSAPVAIESQQADYNGYVWFKELTAAGDFGRFEMTFRDVEINGELNPRAFKPPRRAVRLERPLP